MKKDIEIEEELNNEEEEEAEEEGEIESTKIEEDEAFDDLRLHQSSLFHREGCIIGRSRYEKGWGFCINGHIWFAKETSIHQIM